MDRSDKDLGRYTQLFAKHLKKRLCRLCYRNDEGRKWCEQQFHNESHASHPSPCAGSRVRVYATAGLRHYHHEFGAERVNHFWEVMHHSLAFALPKVLVVDPQIILGTQEALYSWAEVNLFLGTTDSAYPQLPTPENAAVTMEMGGTSFQVTLPLTDQNDAHYFHKAEQEARTRDAQDFLLSAIDLRSAVLPSATGWELYKVATFSFLSIFSGRERLRCCEQRPDPQDNAFMCHLDGAVCRRPEECRRLRQSRHKVGGRISMLRNLLKESPGTPEQEGDEDRPPKLLTCLSSPIELDGELYGRARSAKGAECDDLARELVESDEHFRLTADFFRQYRKRAARPIRAVGDFALLREVGLQDGRATLAEVRDWAIETIDNPDEMQRGSERSDPLAGSNAAFMLLLYHLLSRLGFGHSEDLQDPHAQFQALRSSPTWAGTGLNQGEWRPDADERGDWELSWNLGALFMQQLTLAYQ